MATNMDLTCCMGNTIDFEENTYKQYYFPTSDDEETPYPIKRASTESLDEFFEEPPKKKMAKLRSSTIGRATKDGGMSYISSNEDDGAVATHLIKIEVYDMEKLKDIPLNEYWKHVDVRVKYYVQKEKKSNHHQRTRQLIYNITKEISNSDQAKKFTFETKEKTE